MSLRIWTELLIWFVALIHFGLFYLEAFVWGNRLPQSFLFDPDELTEVVAIFALNQGVYNLVIAIGLILSSRIIRVLSYETALYLCLSMTLAGIVGGVTAKWTITLIQAAPALIAAALIFAALRRQAAAPRGELGAAALARNGDTTGRDNV